MGRQHGDRSENADYQFGKRRLREIDRRSRYLLKRLENAAIVDPADQAQRDRVFFGVSVIYVDEADTERTVTIVGADEADSSNGTISLTAPVAVAFIKARARVGDAIDIHTPRGIEVIEVLAIRYPDRS